MSIATYPLLDDPYPASDGTPMAETPTHVRLMARLLAMLEFHFRHKNDVFVAANIFLYYKEGDSKKRRSPDVMIVKGVDKSIERRSFKTWIERAVPCCIIELTSKETADEDLEAKKALYQQLGVREYFLFDPLNEYLPRQFMAYRLVGDEYEEMRYEDDGSVISAELGLRLCPEGENLALYHAQTGERLLYLDELHESLDEAHNELAEEHRRNAELQAELARLKAGQSE
jgi:Uma2 family endonuclease